MPPPARDVDLRIGPGGDLYYVDYDRGAVHRIHYTGATGMAARSAAPRRLPGRRRNGEIFGGN
jgi:hypothetical protein